MKNNNVEALTKERKGCNGMHLIIGDRQTKLGEPDLFLTADSLIGCFVLGAWIR